MPQNISYFVCIRIKHFGKKRKCWLPAFSPFSHNVFKVVVVLVLKTRNYSTKSSSFAELSLASLAALRKRKAKAINLMSNGKNVYGTIYRLLRQPMSNTF